MITAIVCVDKNYGIGRNNDLLIRIPNDMKRFSRLTNNGFVLMGRKTYDSLPQKPLKKRVNLVITGSGTGDPNNAKEEEPTYISMEKVKEWLLEKRSEKSDSKISIIGGGQVFKELLPYCDVIYITKIFKAFENVDVYCPNIEELPGWTFDYYASDVMEHEGINYQYRRYKNKHPIKAAKKK